MNISTKEKIIEVAIELFSEHGYGQTSVREICRKADVNLAAINYHFKNKEGLYAEILKYSFETFEIGLSKIDSSLSVEKFAVEFYRFFRDNSAVLKNVFKLFVYDTVELSDPMEIHKNQKVVGPPGSDILAEIILRELGFEPPLADLFFVVDTIASHVFHKALVDCSNKVDSMKEEMKGTEMGELFTDEAIEMNIKKISRLALDSIRS